MNLFLLFASVLLICSSKISGQSITFGNKANSSSDTTLSSKESRNKQIALASIEAIAKGDVDEALKYAHVDIINVGNGSIPPAKGIERVKTGLKMFSAALPVDKVDDLTVFAEGDWVIVWGRWSGSWKGDMLGQTATGKPYTKRDVEIFRFNEEGKIIEHHSVQSLLDVATQIGLKLPERKPAP